MNKEEALCLALHALKLANYKVADYCNGCTIEEIDHAITVIENALEQPEPAPVASEPSKIDPIAVVTGTHAGYFVVKPTDPAMVLPVNMALYTHPKE